MMMMYIGGRWKGVEENWSERRWEGKVEHINLHRLCLAAVRHAPDSRIDENWGCVRDYTEGGEGIFK
jgi:hypothetical protein